MALFPSLDVGNDVAFVSASDFQGEVGEVVGEIGGELPWEEPSMDQCQCRGELLKNFQDHWSIRISPGKGMDQ